MSLGITTSLRGNVTPAIEEVIAKTQPKRVAGVISEPARVFWRDRFISLGRNKHGWPSTGFWEGAARDTRSAVVDQGLLLTCSKLGARQRWLGGRITPQKARALAIPISPVSYGHSPSEFPGLFLMKTAKGAFLVQAQDAFNRTKKDFQTNARQLGGNKKRRLRAGLNFLFKLSAGVNQLPNERVVPTADEFTEVAMGAIQKEILN
jgi:hypothetical protein